ncbi:unnamed protein product [Rhodiola kirilowii]
MKKKKSKTLEEPQPQSDFSHALTRVAVAQICESVGYASSKSSALETLTTVASLYLQSVTALAACRANRSARTQSNLLDIVAALEDLHIGKGFRGASDVSIPLLKSSLLVEIMDFVDRVDEIPFAQPIRRSMPVKNPRIGLSEVEARREHHIPMWLPPFPDPRTYREAVVGEKLGLGGNGEVLWPYGSCGEVSVSGSDQERECRKRELLTDRCRVVFKFGVKRKNGLVIKDFCDDSVFVGGEVAVSREERGQTLKEDKTIKVYSRRRLLFKNPEKRIVRSQEV